MIRVVAIITAKPGRRDELLSFFREIIPTVRAEQGCIEYTPVIDAESSPSEMGSDVYVVIEAWESLEALKAHSRAPHMAGFGAKAKDLIAKRAIHYLSPA